MSEFYSKGVKVRQEVYDQVLLDFGCIYVDVLGYEDEVWEEVVKESIFISYIRIGFFLGQRQFIGKVWLFFFSLTELLNINIDLNNVR